MTSTSAISTTPTQLPDAGISFWPTVRSHVRLLAMLLIVCFATSQANAAEQKPYLLHLPGIGGHMRIDDLMTSGLSLGGLAAEINIYDWTGGNPGLPALAGYDRNHAEARKAAELITRVRRANPDRRIIITSHSGGGAIAAWMLEDLPDDVKIDTLLMLAPALSPQYDLSSALRHVNGKAYVFSSTLDPVDGFGTRTMGTMDRIKTDAAGNVGFSIPKGADREQYKKLVSFPYTQAWLDFDNAGDHIGTMNRTFGRFILAPLLTGGHLPGLALPATQPTSAPAGGE